MRKMLCLLLMLAMLTPCLPALAEDTDALDVILLSSASIEPLQETLRPGKAVTLRFTSPVDGTVTLLLRNAETLETVLRQMVETKWLRPRRRPYETDNTYAALEREMRLRKEVKALEEQAKKARR